MRRGRDTYFVPSFGNLPKRLVGRDDCMDELAYGLTSPSDSAERSVLIRGPRGYGKTAILQEFRRLCEAKGYACVLVSSNSQMLDYIIEELADRLGDNEPGRRLSGGSLGVGGILSIGIETESRTDAPARTFMKALSTALDGFREQGKGVVLLVDEVTSTGDELRCLASAFQSLKGRGYDLTLVMAGLPQCISALVNDKVLTFLGRARRLDLGRIETGEVVSYYAEAFDELGLRVGRGDVYRLASASGGVPYAMQLMGHYLVIALAPGGEAQPEDVDYAIDCMRADFATNVLDLTLATLSPRDMRLLEALSAHPGGRAYVRDLQAELGWEHGYFARYRDRAIDFGVACAPARGVLEVAIPYLAERVRERLAEEGA